MKQGIGELVRMLISMPKITKNIKRLQDKGYPIKSVLDIIQNDDNTHTIVYTSSDFQPCADTFSDKYVFVGPSIRPATDKIVKTKEKLIYISMGTVNNDMMPLYKTCITTLADTEYQVIISVGNLVSIKEFGKLPENIWRSWSTEAWIIYVNIIKSPIMPIGHWRMQKQPSSFIGG